MRSMIGTSIWCTIAKARMSFSIAVMRGDAWNKGESKRRCVLTVIVCEPRRSSSSIRAAWRRGVVRAAWRGKRGRRGLYRRKEELGLDSERRGGATGSPCRARRGRARYAGEVRDDTATLPSGAHLSATAEKRKGGGDGGDGPRRCRTVVGPACWAEACGRTRERKGREREYPRVACGLKLAVGQNGSPRPFLIFLLKTIFPFQFLF